MSKYLHVIYLDKFTKGFVSFIANNFGTEDHAFIIHGDAHQYEFTLDGVDMLRMNSYRDYKTNEKARKLIEECNMLIINGAFGAENIFVYFPKSCLRKAYIMFWGADLYNITNKYSLLNIKKQLKKMYFKHVIRNAGGVINLISGDYDILCKTVIPKGKHFVAPMCDDGSKFKKQQLFFSHEKSASPVKIIIGNSATPSNCHIEVFKILEKFRNEDIEIICPLSYGDNEYAVEVIAEGNRIFGNKFTPVTDYMDIDEYYRLISDASVAVFNNNRQQAMGNIHALLAFKCKIYMNNGASMWQYFTDKHKFSIFDISSIEKESFKQFVSMSAADADKNRDIYVRIADLTPRIEAWKKIFNSII